MSKYGGSGKDSFDDVRCSFCGKRRGEVKKLIAGPNVYICNECVELCREIVQEDMVNEDPPEERNAMYREIAEKVGEGAAAYGIEVIDVKIKRIDLPSENEQAVYTRMISERKQIAEKYKADGELAAAEIINAADKEYNTIIADAQLAAEQKIAEGEREYMNLLAQAYDTQEKQEFYTFIRALEALEASLTGSEKTLIIGRDSPLAEILLGN